MKKAIRFLSNIKYMFEFSWKISKSNFIIAILYIVVDVVEPLALLFFPAYVIDELVYGKSWMNVVKYIILLIATLFFTKVIRAVLDIAYKFICDKVKLKSGFVNVENFMSTDYQNIESGMIIETGDRVLTHVNAYVFVQENFRSTLTSIINVATYSYILFQLNPIVILIILGIIGTSALISKRRETLNYKFQPLITRFARRFSYLYGTMISFDNGKEIRINNADDWLKKKYQSETNEYIKNHRSNSRKYLVIDTCAHALGAIQIIVVYGFCAFKAVVGSISIGSFSAYIGAINNFIASITRLIENITYTTTVSKYVDDYKQFIADTQPTHKVKGIRSIAGMHFDSHEIELRNVSFHYPNNSEMVLKNVSLTIKAGERLAIVGYNGAGKSTLIKLICRLYEPTEGAIYYNGIDISTIKYDEYMSLLAVVFQDYKFFSFCVKDNIILGGNYNEERLITSLEKSGLKRKIDTLRNGIDTSVTKTFDEQGIEFSGGESQKLATARAYYKNSPIVILDEPTSALDPISEHNLYSQFNEIIGEKTAVYITHRLASVKFCDKIACFENGVLKEYGTHDELMDLDGIYKDMFVKQAQYYVE